MKLREDLIGDGLVGLGWLLVAGSLYRVYPPLCPIMVGIGMVLVGLILVGTKRRQKP